LRALGAASAAWVSSDDALNAGNTDEGRRAFTQARLAERVFAGVNLVFPDARRSWADALLAAGIAPGARSSLVINQPRFNQAEVAAGHLCRPVI